jgi:hypothetical protein
MTQRTAALVAIAGAVMLGVGCLLPWATITTGLGSASVNGIEGDGVIILGIALIIGIAAVAALDRPGRLLPVVIFTGASLALIALAADYLSVVERLEEASSSVARASVGAGLYLSMAGGLVAVVGAVMMMRNAEKDPAAGEGSGSGVQGTGES